MIDFFEAQGAAAIHGRPESDNPSVEQPVHRDLPRETPAPAPAAAPAAAAERKIAVRIDGLAFSYPDGRAALRGIDIVIEAGDCVALVGPNGAGKSTLLWHLNGLLPAKLDRSGLSLGHGHGHASGSSGSGGRSASSGPRVWIDGLEVATKNIREVRRKVGLLFQDPDDQLFCPSVLEDVAFGPLNLGLKPREAHALALECLTRVELVGLADRPPHHLSLGERKRVCLAGVLACSPTVLALDEPTANLDPRSRRRLLNLIRTLDATKLIATHDLEMVVELCPRTILLDGGRVVADGPSTELLSDKELLEAHGLEVPLSLSLRQGQGPGQGQGTGPGPVGP